MTFSPRAWGWTVLAHEAAPALTRFPHARGGGPLLRLAVPAAHAVFPTRVGVDRSDLGHGVRIRAFSPRAWGWTASRLLQIHATLGFPHARGGGPATANVTVGRVPVFPTRVGVDRVGGAGARRAGCFPHARGGGPAAWHGIESGVYVFPTRVGVDRRYRGLARTRRSFSPRAWGWTGSSCGRFAMAKSFPHARGGGPRPPGWSWRRSSFSPRAWGWTDCVNPVGVGLGVFPTRVGVDRLSEPKPM